MKESKPTSPYKVAFISVIVAIVLVTALFSVLNWQKVTNFFTPEKVEVVIKDTVVQTDTVTAVTVQQVLESRNKVIESKRKDSVFLSMPEVVLAAVLMKIGTDTTIEEIVIEYELHKSMYNDVALGANIQKNIIQEKDTSEVNYYNNIFALP